MSQIERGCWKPLNAAWHTHIDLIVIAKGFGDGFLNRCIDVKKHQRVKWAARKLWIMGDSDACISFCYRGSASGKRDTERGRMIYQVVNGRALE